MALAVALAVALATVPALAPAQSVIDERPVRFFLGTGLTTGGDRLAVARYTNGRDDTIRAGALLQVHGGVQFRVAPDVSLQLAIGYHVDAVDGFYDSVWFRRVPIEGLAHVHVHPQWRIGGGVRVAVEPKLSSSGWTSIADEEFKTSVGAVLEIEHLFNHWLGLKLRGVSERFKSKAGLPTVDGSHIGLMVNFYF